MADVHVYRVLFVHQGKLYEIYARQVRQGEMFGFVEIEGLLFGEKSAVVVDPSEERLKDEFAGVRRFFVPMHAVMRIDELEKQGNARIRDLPESGNVTPFPGGLYPPPGPR